MIFDTGSNLMWVSSPESKYAETHKAFSCELSETCRFGDKMVSVKYGSGDILGRLVKDTVSIGNSEMRDFNFILV